MNLEGNIDVVYKFNYGTVKLKDLKPGMSTLADVSGFGRGKNTSLITNIFFVHISSDNELLYRFTLKWRKTKALSTITVFSPDIKFAHYDFNCETVPLKKYLQLGMLGQEAKIIKVERVASKVCHFFTESGYFVVDNVLFHRSHDWLLSHAKYLNKLSPLMSKIESSLLGSYLT